MSLLLCSFQVGNITFYPYLIYIYIYIKNTLILVVLWNQFTYKDATWPFAYLFCNNFNKI